jgi:hypothetical protein
MPRPRCRTAVRMHRKLRFDASQLQGDTRCPWVRLSPQNLGMSGPAPGAGDPPVIRAPPGRVRPPHATAGASAKPPAAARADSPRTFHADAAILLTCHDSAGQQGEDGPPARLVNRVGGFIGVPNAYDTLPVQRLNGYRYLAWKTALSVAPGAGYRTVSVVTPTSARLSYGSSISKASRSVRLPACGRRYALYVGGILVRHPACVTIAVTGADGKSATVSVPVLRSCPRHAR